ncbi:MAG: chemotaxis protein CheW [Gemmatimonadales bacterium]|nr:chemotaxis protein CheW [Gemmatimonadales bacterium]
MSERTQFCTFTVGGLFFGLEVRAVQEVIRAQQLTRVPLSPPVIQGLINLRGQIVTAVDLRLRLDLPPRAAGEAPMTIVVQTHEGPVACLVDEIGDVVDVDEAWFERPPETLQPSLRALIPGAYKLPDRLLLILDTERALSAAAISA